MPSTTELDEILLVERRGGVALVTLNRPQARNALDDALRERLRQTLLELDADGDVAVVVLTGAGKAFCGGGDVAGMAQRLAAPVGSVAFNGVRRQRRVFELINGLHRFSKVTIAAVNGPAVGLGLDLALACDFVVAASHSWVAASYVDRGLIPDGGGMYFMPRRIGIAATKDIVFSGRRVAAAEALSLGLVDELAEAEVVEAALARAARYADKPAAAIALSKEILNRSGELSLELVAALGGEAQGICYTTDDHRDSVRAFLDRGAGRGATDNG